MIRNVRDTLLLIAFGGIAREGHDMAAPIAIMTILVETATNADLIALLRKLTDREPLTPDEISCLYCGSNIAIDPGEDHTPDCPYLQVKQLLDSMES